MAKSSLNLANVLIMILGYIAMLGVGGLFASGGALNFPILSLLPLIIHQIVGWTIIGGTLLSAILQSVTFFS
ncbi:MAG: hypothetical protein ACOCV1_00075 [Bacillota bacterium]